MFLHYYLFLIIKKVIGVVKIGFNQIDSSFVNMQIIITLITFNQKHKQNTHEASFAINFEPCICIYTNTSNLLKSKYKVKIF